nr:hypothetical protein [Tanacetum cinerariifolium]
GVEELKKNCKDKGCKERSPPYNLRQKSGDDSDIEDKSSWTQ